MSESLSIKAGVEGIGVEEGLKRIEERLNEFHERIIKAFAVVGVVLEFREALDKAFEGGEKGEELVESMSILAGGTEKANKRLAEMSELIEKSPFNRDQFADAYKTLQLYTNGLYSGNNALKLVGDVAAATEMPIDRVAAAVGRAYESISAGDGGGRSLKMLEKLGVISVATGDQIDRMGKGKGNAGAVWDVLQTELLKFDGTMEAKSHSWSALMKNFNENVEAVYREFAMPIMDALKPYLESAGNMAARVAAVSKRAGEEVARVFKAVEESFKTGELWSLVGTGMEIAFKNGINYLYGGLYGAADAFGQVIIGFFNENFADGVGNIFIGIAEQFGAAMMHALQGPLNMFISAVNYEFDKANAKANRASLAKDYRYAENDAERHAAQAKVFEAHGNDKGAAREWEAWKNMRLAAEKVGDDMKAAGETANMSLGDYIAAHANDTFTIAGMSSEDWKSKGQTDVKNGATELRPIVESTMAAAMAAIGKAAPADMFPGLKAETAAFQLRIEKLAGALDAAGPKEKEIKNLFRESPYGQNLDQTQKAVADSFREIGAGGRVGTVAHADPMVEQQKLTNDKLDELISQGGDDGGGASSGDDWSTVQ